MSNHSDRSEKPSSIDNVFVFPLRPNPPDTPYLDAP